MNNRKRVAISFRNLISVTLTTLALSFLVAPTTNAFVGKWRSFTNVGAVNDLIKYHGFLFAATTGGIRKINPINNEETDFTNIDGIFDLNIVGLAIDDDDELWAASRSGRLFKFEQDRWSSWGESYKVAAWKINSRAILCAGNYLVVGCNKGLTFFDRKKGVSQANLTKFGKSNLIEITGLVRSGDTLYISNGTEVFGAAMDFKNLLSSKYSTINDPQIWLPIKNLVEPKDLGFPLEDSLTKIPVDSIDLLSVNSHSPDLTQGRPVHLCILDGRLVAHDSGTVLTSPNRIRALLGRPLILNGKAFPVFNRIEVAITLGDKVYLGSKLGLVEYRVASGQFWDVMPKKRYPFDTLANIAASTKGVYALTSSTLFKLEGEDWNPIFIFGLSPEVFGNELKVLATNSEDRVIMGNWGQGVFDFYGGVKKQYVAGTETCLHPTVGENYTVVHSLSDPSGEDIWFTMLRPTQTTPTSFWMAHLNTRTGKIYCPEFVGDGEHTYSIRILSDTLFGVASDRGIFLYHWKKNGDPSSVSFASRMGADRGTEIGRDLAQDRFGRLWAISNDQIGFVDSVNYKLEKSLPLTMVFPENMDGKSCRVMESDALQNFWIGCDNGLFHLQPTAQALDPIVDRFTSDDGLASNRIFDISVVKETGVVWVTTENGISVYESDGVSRPIGLDKVKAYPNPFLKKHRLLILKGVPHGGTAAIYTESGNVVRQFQSQDAKGDEIQWDGTNAFGNTVKPGIYFYSVSANGKSSRGKIIVAR